MNELIPISQASINGAEALTCDGRALHEFLEVGKDFSTWLKDRVAKYGFIEGVDFIPLPKSGERDCHGGQNRIDYLLTIDMAKQLAMVENNEKGVQVRRYFIECERLAKEAARPAPKPRRGTDDATLNARSAAVSLRMLARMNVYPDSMKAVFAAKSVAILTGEPLAGLLPPVADCRDQWLSPTGIGEHFGITPNAVGRLLKSTGLHGKDDPEHKHSQPLWDKSPYSNKEVVSYVYDPAVVLPRISEAIRIEAGSRPS